MIRINMTEVRPKEGQTPQQARAEELDARLTRYKYGFDPNLFGDEEDNIDDPLDYLLEGIVEHLELTANEDTAS